MSEVANGLPDDKELVLRVMPMPADTNPAGDVFGGWIMAQVDIAGAVPARRRARGRVATIAVNSFLFKQPVSTGDLVSFSPPSCMRAVPRSRWMSRSGPSATPRIRLPSRSPKPSSPTWRWTKRHQAGTRGNLNTRHPGLLVRAGTDPPHLPDHFHHL